MGVTPRDIFGEIPASAPATTGPAGRVAFHPSNVTFTHERRSR
jgi:hypothetical protein